MLKISIITVSYNAAKTIEHTIRSVVNQTYENIEYIIIDGGSTDGTVDIIKKYEDKIAYWVSEPDKGIYDAMNKGISAATGDVIGILNSDDWYDDNTLEKVASCMEGISADGICGSIRYSDENGNSLMIPPVHSSPDLCVMQRGMSIAHPSVFVWNSFYKKYGLFSLDYPIAGDYELLLRALSMGANLIYSDSVYVNFRLGGASSQNSLQSVDDVKRARIKNKVNLIKRNYYYLCDLADNYYCIVKKKIFR